MIHTNPGCHPIFAKTIISDNCTPSTLIDTSLAGLWDIWSSANFLDGLKVSVNNVLKSKVDYLSFHLDEPNKGSYIKSNYNILSSFRIFSRQNGDIAGSVFIMAFAFRPAMVLVPPE